MLFTPVDDISEERWRTGPGTNLKAWRIPQCPLLMECSSGVLEQIRREVEAGRNLVRAERETGGVLFGIHEPGPPGSRCEAWLPGPAPPPTRRCARRWSSI